MADKANVIKNSEEVSANKMEENSSKVDEKAKKPLVLRILTIALDVFIVLFAAAAVFTMVLAVSSKRNPGEPSTIFGTQLYFVQSDSMGACDDFDTSKFKIKSIPVKSCVFVEALPTDSDEIKEAQKRDEWYSKIEVGDVLTFKYVISKQETITHRVVKIETKTGGYIFTLEGDNRSSESNVGQQVIDTTQYSSSGNYILGKVTGQNYALGLVVYALKQPVGIALIVILPCAIIIFYNLYRIIRVIVVDKKEKLAVETNKREEEIELLKQQIAELQKGDSNKKENFKEDK